MPPRRRRAAGDRRPMPAVRERARCTRHARRCGDCDRRARAQRRPADRQPVDLRSVGWPTPTGTLWPSLPQVPTPASSARSLPTIDTLGQRIGAVADQRRALDRIGELAVLDLPRLGRREHELAARDVDLAAAEIDRVEAVLAPTRGSRRDRASPASMIVLVIRGIGSVRERLAAAVAGGRDAHQRGVEAVLHVALEDAVLDQHRALRRIAFVVDVERAAALRRSCRRRRP